MQKLASQGGLQACYIMKELVQYAQDSGCVEQIWRKHAHLTEVTDLHSNLRETKKQVNLAQSHTNYQMLMMAEDLIGVIALNKTSDIIQQHDYKYSQLLRFPSLFSQEEQWTLNDC
jgi:hypothetical protein